jgi:alkanesulfonate monooxygenase SsuD/methylene tetrahydromethanopterin reductase-like flavin-dependent oxidoreductase (luciferase family)
MATPGITDPQPGDRHRRAFAVPTADGRAVAVQDILVGTMVDLAPLAPGSVSLRLYPHNDLPATEILEELEEQARLAVAVGFDGVMTNEHHNGFSGYMPNPIQTAGWLLETMPSGWAAPCPLLLTLRPPALVAEEMAWLAARFPGRVGLGMAAGSLPEDFSIMGLTKDGLSDRFAVGLAVVAGMLSGRDPGSLAQDPAIRQCATHPIPVVSAAMSPAAVRRAAGAGAGLIFESLSAPDRCRELVGIYTDAGGTAPIVMIRRVWVGTPPIVRQAAQLDVYRGYAEPSAQVHWKGDQMLHGDTASSVAEQVLAVAEEAGVGALNLRVHVPGLSPSEIHEQISQLAPVVDLVHDGLSDPSLRR